ncbi:MAG TPA: hypothetical protein VGF92_21030 [Stellaceae bacterium]|jgi:hypothetical protein
MSCLFVGDYGLPQPSFDPLAQDGALIKGFEAHRAALQTAQNLGQLQAMERKFAKGETVAWCDSGYGWVYEQKVGDLFGAIIAFVILPWLVMRVAPCAAERLGLTPFKRSRQGSPIRPAA